MLSMRRLRVVDLSKQLVKTGATLPVARVREMKCAITVERSNGDHLEWDSGITLDEAIKEVDLIRIHLKAHGMRTIISAYIHEFNVEVIHVGAGLDVPMYKLNNDIEVDPAEIMGNVVYDSLKDAEENDMSISLARRMFTDGTRSAFECLQESLDLIDNTYFPIPFTTQSATGKGASA